VTALSDEALMDAYRAGDLRAFDALFARHAAAIYRFFFRSFRDAAVCEDLLQITFLNMHRGRETFRTVDERAAEIGGNGARDGGPTSTGTSTAGVRRWMFGIAGRVRLDEWRKRKRNLEDLEREETTREPEQPPEAPEDPRIALLLAALSKLPEIPRQIIHLHRFEELSFREIGDILGLSEGAVKLRAFRGYERLRDELKGLEGAS
jgi:RNA polymerase sigma-70 factor (ECF subfamily)